MSIVVLPGEPGQEWMILRYFEVDGKPQSASFRVPRSEIEALVEQLQSALAEEEGF